MDNQWTLERAAASLSAKGPAPPIPGPPTSGAVERLEKSNHPIAKIAMAKTAFKAAGKIAAGLTEIVAVKWATKPDDNSEYGYDVEEPDDDDIQMLEDATAAGFESQWPDADIPWWLGMCLAAGNIAIGVHRSRQPRLTPRAQGKKSEEKAKETKSLSAKGSVTPIRPEVKTKEKTKDSNENESLDDRPVGT